MDRARAREVIGLPPDAKLVGAVADCGPTANPWKGGQYAVKAMEAAWKRWPEAYYLNIGGLSAAIHDRILSIRRIDDPATLAIVLSCLDVFLYPSLADNCPLVILEALACGVPIVAFETGGIPELLEDGIEGRVIEYRNEMQLAAALCELLERNDLQRQFGTAARARAVGSFRLEQTIDHYERVYQKSLADSELRTERDRRRIR